MRRWGNEKGRGVFPLPRLDKVDLTAISAFFILWTYVLLYGHPVPEPDPPTVLLDAIEAVPCEEGDTMYTPEGHAWFITMCRREDGAR